MYPYVTSLEEIQKHPNFPFRNCILNKEEYLLSNLYWLYLCKPYVCHHKNAWKGSNEAYMNFPFPDWDGNISLRGYFYNAKNGISVTIHFFTNTGISKNDVAISSPLFFINSIDRDLEWDMLGYKHDIGISTDLGDEKCYEFLHNFLKIIFVDDLPFEQLKAAIEKHDQQHRSQYCRFKEA